MAPTLPLPAPAAFGSVLLEALKCMALAFKDSLKPKVVFHSLALWLVSLTFWVLIFCWQWNNILRAAQAASGFVAMGVFGFLHLLGSLRGVAGVTGKMAKNVLGGGGFSLLAYVFAALSFVLLVLISIRILLEVFLMKYVQKRTLTRYPQIQKGVQSKWLEGLQLSSGNNVKALLITVACLFIPVVNGIVILFVGCYFNAKSLVGDALEDLATVREVKQFIRENRLGILALGLLHLGIVLIPFVGLLAPAVIGSSICHFCFRAKARQLAQEAG